MKFSMKIYEFCEICPFVNHSAPPTAPCLHYENLQVQYEKNRSRRMDGFSGGGGGGGGGFGGGGGGGGFKPPQGRVNTPPRKC